MLDISRDTQDDFVWRTILLYNFTQILRKDRFLDNHAILTYDPRLRRVIPPLIAPFEYLLDFWLSQYFKNLDR